MSVDSVPPWYIIPRTLLCGRRSSLLGRFRVGSDGIHFVVAHVPEIRHIFEAFQVSGLSQNQYAVIVGTLS